MAMRITEIKTANAEKKAREINIGLQSFMIANTGDTTAYIRECAEDGIECSAENGYPIFGRSAMDKVLTAEKISVFGGSVAVMIVEV